MQHGQGQTPSPAAALRGRRAWGPLCCLCPGWGPIEKGLVKVPSALRCGARVQVVGWQCKVTTLTSCSCLAKLPPAGSAQHQTLIISQFWRPETKIEVWAGLVSSRALRVHLVQVSLPASGFAGHSWSSLGSRSSTLTSASVVTWLPSLSLSVSLLLLHGHQS